MKRRAFLRSVPAYSGLLAMGPLWLGACGEESSTGPGADSGSDLPPLSGASLRLPSTVHPSGTTLTAREGVASFGNDGSAGQALLFGDTLPGPTFRVRNGDRVQTLFRNGLPDGSIVHWHGLDVPDEADGHPRLEVGPGGTFAYDFVVRNRAGTYWYHPHPHGQTGPQTYRGLSGFYIVDDADSDSLGLPTGDRDIPLLIQDRRLDTEGTPTYQPTGFDRMVGYLGDVGFVNGLPFPYLWVDRTHYRFRILNGSNARVFDLALSDGRPFTLIGTDGGLIESPQAMNHVLLGPAERVEVLVDFSNDRAGAEVQLQSRPFVVGGPPSSQGIAMDLMRFAVTASEPRAVAPPTGLPQLPTPADMAGVERQSFTFTSMMGRHVINGRSFEMNRVDARIPLGDPQIWRLVNSSPIPHPVHIHSSQFRILTRDGGRRQVFPWERGLKDTVLLMPFEVVEILVHFSAYRGLYLMHCHNLEHEDAGMMMNFEVA